MRELPLLSFSHATEFESWLADQPDHAVGAWLRFAKKGAPEQTISKSDAFDSALVHGWVDGQIGSVDAFYFKTLFTPRRQKSAWSQVNCERVERLLTAGCMKPKGQAQIDRAKADGRWAAAYAPQSQAAPDNDLKAALDAEPAARALFDALDFSQSVLRALSGAPNEDAGKTRREDRRDGRQARSRRNLSSPARSNPMTSYVALLRAVNVGAGGALFLTARAIRKNVGMNDSPANLFPGQPIPARTATRNSRPPCTPCRKSGPSGPRARQVTRLRNGSSRLVMAELHAR